MQKRSLLWITTLFILLLPLTGCQNSATNPNLDLSQNITLTVAGAWEDFPALEASAESFAQLYPNCTIEYEYVQNYYDSLQKRLESGEDSIDLFITTNIQADSELLPYVLELYSQADLDLSQTFPGLIQNFEYRDSPEKQIYAIPLGAEIRGLYVNKTLLQSLGLTVPTNRVELLEACQVLKKNGYLPMQGNPGMFGQQLLYPYICNQIAHAADPDMAYKLVANRSEEAADLFQEPLQFLYGLVENYYYDYKYAETELNLFNATDNAACSRYFLHIANQDGTYQKVDDLGQIAFMPGPMSLGTTIAKMKEDYHSNLDYEFVLAPVGEDGGYAYLSPAHGIAINKNSPQTAWAVEFLDFLFQPENNITFAELHHITPNTEEALKLIHENFQIPDDHICHLGQVTFDYDFYELICASLVEISKANNPKYMQDSGNGEKTIYPFAYYLDHLKTKLAGE